MISSLLKRSPWHLAATVVFTILAVQFLAPALTYAFMPAVALAQLDELNRAFGGGPYVHNESDSHMWRYLASANVMTLGFICALLAIDLRRFNLLLVPLIFMKMCAALSWFAGYLNEPTTPVFLAAAVLDFVTSAAFAFFGRMGLRERRT